MAYIKVDRKMMLNTADQVDAYVAKITANMIMIDATVESVSNDWVGEDYNQFKNEWNEINSSGSTTHKMKVALKNYANAIRDASDLYKEAQARAFNRSEALCK